MAKASHIIAHTEGNVGVVNIMDVRLTDLNMIERLGKELLELVEKRYMIKMVLDFSKVKYLSSAALRQLITLKKRLDREKGEVKLCSIAPDILTVFKTTQLDRVFDIHPNVQSAVARFQKKKWKLF